MSNKRKLPPELTEELEPIRIGLLRADYEEALSQAAAARAAELTRRLEILREWYGVASGPDCWRTLCLAMAAERFPGFREKSGRKPPKWTMGTLTMLAGELRREMDSGAPTKDEAARRLASREPWARFLSRGRWKGKAASRDRAPWENLLAEYTHMPEHYRAVGEETYQAHVEGHTLDEWDKRVQDFLEHPIISEK